MEVTEGILKMESLYPLGQIDAQGRITLPFAALYQLDWRAGTAVAFEAEPAAQALVIRRFAVRCCFCGASERLKPFEGQLICAACRQRIALL